MRLSSYAKFIFIGCLGCLLIRAAEAQDAGLDVPTEMGYVSSNTMHFDDACGTCNACETSSQGSGCHSTCQCWLCRGTLFGDPGGYRSCLADNGITYSGSLTQFYQGVSSGGANQVFRYGGKLDSIYNFNTEKLGLWAGGGVTLHTESGYGQNAILDAAGMAPVNSAFLTPRIADLPVYAISSLYYEQELAGGYAATMGRYSLLDFYGMLYPDYGKGLDGFMNTSSWTFLNVIPTLATVINGAGLIKAGEKGVEAAVMVLDQKNVATTTGLGELFNNGATLLAAGRKFTEFGGLDGSHLFLGTYNTGDFTAFDRNGLSFNPGSGISIPETSGSWFAGYVGKQDLWQDPCAPQRRVWLTVSMGWADKQTSPYQWTGSYTLEAMGLNRNRISDRVGIGYFYSDVSDDLRNLVNGPILNTGLQDLQGGEVYYNAAITPWFHLTGDAQFIETEIASQDTAVVLGLRGKLDF